MAEQTAAEIAAAAEALEKQNAAEEKAQALQQQQAQAGTTNISRDVNAGRQFGLDVLGEEGLGRLSDDDDIKGVLDRLNKVSQTGLSGAESVAQREKALKGIGQATQTAQRGLLASLGSRGVRGGVAGAQLGQIQASGLQQRAGVERDLFLAGEGIKREGLKDFADALGQVKTFDLGQAAREKDIELSAGLGFGQIGQAERSAKAQADASRAAAASRGSGCFVAGTLIKMLDKSYKNIEDIKLGDLTSQGEISGVSMHMAGDLVEYKGITVDGLHPVLEDGVWILPKDSQYAKEIEGEQSERIHVYNLWNTFNRLEIKGENNEDILFTDYEGMEVDDEYIINRLNNIEASYEVMVKLSAGKIR
jgi:hypothetical protein